MGRAKLGSKCPLPPSNTIKDYITLIWEASLPSLLNHALITGFIYTKMNEGEGGGGFQPHPYFNPYTNRFIYKWFTLNYKRKGLMVLTLKRFSKFYYLKYINQIWKMFNNILRKCTPFYSNLIPTSNKGKKNILFYSYFY